MENPFKNNLVCGLIGYIAGTLTIVGGQALLVSKGPEQGGNQIQSLYSIKKGGSAPSSDKDFHGLENNPDGDVAITIKGNCYHSLYGCSSLKNSHQLRTVDREAAEAVGMKACSKCKP